MYGKAWKCERNEKGDVVNNPGGPGLLPTCGEEWDILLSGVCGLLREWESRTGEDAEPDTALPELSLRDVLKLRLWLTGRWGSAGLNADGIFTARLPEQLDEPR